MSALLFVGIVASVQLRQEFSDVGIVYIEYAYLWLHFVLVLTAFLSYVYQCGPRGPFRWMNVRDNLISRVAYWPFVLGGLIMITVINMR